MDPRRKALLALLLVKAAELTERERRVAVPATTKPNGPGDRKPPAISTSVFAPDPGRGRPSAESAGAFSWFRLTAIAVITAVAVFWVYPFVYAAVVVLTLFNVI